MDLFEEANREEVRKVYRKHYSNLNQTSLLVYHGAIAGNTVVSFVNRARYFTGRLSPVEVISNELTGTLLTGDLSIRSKSSLKELTGYFHLFLERVSVFLLPHHAARANWNFSHPSGLENFEIYISSAGENRKHHPSGYVLADVDQFCMGDCVLVNEVNGYQYINYLKS